MCKYLKIPDNITFQSIDKRVYILNIENGEYYKLSESATLIWNEIEKGVDVDNIKMKLKSLFDRIENINDDVDELLTDFTNLGLLEDN